jgi:exosortase A-associated hydrolase 2
MSDPHEQAVQFRSGDALLRGMLHTPSAGASAGIVICPPFAEEKKCAHRVLVHAARAFAQAGFVALRFDFSGIGESTGDPSAGCPSRWRQDIERATEFLWQSTSADRLGLLGLRLGATLAAAVARDMAPEWLMLWEPIVNGQRYLRLNMRRSLIKKMITEGDEYDAKAAANERQGGPEDVDFDGHVVSARCQAEISEVDLVGEATAAAQKTLVLGIGPRDTLSRELTGLAEAYQAAEAPIASSAVREPPFWNMIGLVRGDETIRATMDWLAPGDGLTATEQ